MSVPIAPRWEWRTFGPAFPTLQSFIRGRPHQHKTTRDTYIVSPAADANVKIRGGLLDVKRLQQVDRGLELWVPVIQAPFPLGIDTIQELFSLWHLAPPADLAVEVSPERFLDVIAQQPRLRRIDVEKQRDITSLDGCLVEFSALIAAGTALETVAVEMEDPALVRKTAARLGFAGMENVSYVTALQRLSGLRGAPSSTSAQEGALP